VEIVLPPGVQDPDLSNNKVRREIILYGQPTPDARPLRVGYVPVCVPLAGFADACPGPNLAITAIWCAGYSRPVIAEWIFFRWADLYTMRGR